MCGILVLGCLPHLERKNPLLEIQLQSMRPKLGFQIGSQPTSHEETHPPLLRNRTNGGEVARLVEFLSHDEQWQWVFTGLFRNKTNSGEIARLVGRSEVLSHDGQ
ncbi:hypothetical protein U1Q18_016296 [Sarracenia purpurea var. burkii]